MKNVDRMGIPIPDRESLGEARSAWVRGEGGQNRNSYFRQRESEEELFSERPCRFCKERMTERIWTEGESDSRHKEGEGEIFRESSRSGKQQRCNLVLSLLWHSLLRSHEEESA